MGGVNGDTLWVGHYLAEKSGRLWPSDAKQRYDVLQWLMFQMGGVGPMFGQNGYFQGYCPEDVPLVITSLRKGYVLRAVAFKMVIFKATARRTYPLRRLVITMKPRGSTVY